jgi:hypothetical protein
MAHRRGGTRLAITLMFLIVTYRSSESWRAAR